MQINQKLVMLKTLLGVMQKSSNNLMFHGLNLWQESSRINEIKRKQPNIQ